MASRTPDPRRLLDAHRQAQVTIDLLKAYAAAAYADLPKINRAVGSNEPARPVSLFTSHEALLLNYEQALPRFDEDSEHWWAPSGNSIWLCDRNAQLERTTVPLEQGMAHSARPQRRRSRWT